MANRPRVWLTAGRLSTAGWLCALLLAVPQAAAKDPPAKKVERPRPSDAPPGFKPAKQLPARQPADYKSAHFLIHTDLAAKDAHELLNRLERMLKLISEYWGQPPVGTIECFVVEDLARWPEGSLEPAGRAKIAEGAGVTVLDSLSLGRKLVAAKARVYATADRGTPQHEAVHAYCGQAFGNTGPLWYAEGMAEMGQYWRQGDASVHCHPAMIDYLRTSRPKPLGEILNEGNPGPNGRPTAQTGDSWQNYAWRWALCHLLANNTNYAQRFRPLGLGLLTGQRVSFADTYGAMADEIGFEYRFFLQHLDEGYRVDLCSWDWKRKFRKPAAGTPMASRVGAKAGWQPSGAIVTADQAYDYSASGVWQLDKESGDVTADGDAQGNGQLEGVIFHDFQLSKPFALGSYGSFTPPVDGRLYLRCRDAWNSLADNKGFVSFKIKPAGQGAPLAKPGKTDEAPAETADAE